MAHEVTCIIPDGNDADRAIDAIGGSSGSDSGGPWRLSQEAAIEGIEKGHWSFYTYAGGQYADVIVVQGRYRKHLRTTSDSTTSNNLLSLPRCR